MNTTGRLTEETKSSIQRGKWNHFMRFILCCWLKNQKICATSWLFSSWCSSTAGCERSFHIVNRVKKKPSTRLLNDTANILLKVGEGGASIADFDPNPVVDHLWVRASNMKALSLWNVQLPSVFFSMKMQWLAKLLWNRPPNATWKENWHTKQKCV